MYGGNKANLNSSDVKETFFEIVKGISKNGVDSIKIGIRPNVDDTDGNYMWVSSEKPRSWGDYIYDED